MAGLFDTSTVTMRATSGRVLSDAESIQADLRGLLTRLAALEGAWVGDGRTAFAAAEARYAEANAKLNAALQTIGTLIRSNEARYASDDADASSKVASAGAGFTVAGF